MSEERPSSEPSAPTDAADESARKTESSSPDHSPDLAAEVSDLKDRLLRALAEQENMRRRSERDRTEAVKFAASGLARDLLSTLDNLRRAIESVPEEQAADETIQRVLSGIVATERGFLGALEKHGIRRIDPLGKPFDPNHHQAMFEVPDPQRPEGTVVQVAQPGYLHHERLLRPAMVAVAKRAGDPVAADHDTVAGES